MITNQYSYEFSEESNLETLLVNQDILGNSGIGSTVWDSALVLAKYFEKRCLSNSVWNPHIHRLNPPKTSKNITSDTPLRIIELGAGTGLVGLVLAKCLESRRIQAELVLSDKSGSLELLHQNVKLANPDSFKYVKISVQELDWTVEVPNELTIPFDLVIAADCVHWPDLFDPLISVMSEISNRETEVMIAYERREFDEEVVFFKKWGEKFTFRNIPEDALDPIYKSDDIYVFTGSKKE